MHYVALLDEQVQWCACVCTHHHIVCMCVQVKEKVEGKCI